MLDTLIVPENTNHQSPILTSFRTLVHCDDRGWFQRLQDKYVRSRKLSNPLQMICDPRIWHAVWKVILIVINVDTSPSLLGKIIISNRTSTSAVIAIG